MFMDTYCRMLDRSLLSGWRNFSFQNERNSEFPCTDINGLGRPRKVVCKSPKFSTTRFIKMRASIRVARPRVERPRPARDPRRYGFSKINVSVGISRCYRVVRPSI